jgi:plasmid stabilization system protein ParE
MPEIVWKHGAEEDLLNVFAELEDYRPGAGERFTEDLDRVLQNLRSHPRLAPLFESPMRRLVVGNTGFGLFYTVEDRGIIIHALIHLSRHPESIRTKLRRLLGLE